MKKLILPIILVCLIACSRNEKRVTLENITTEKAAGNFTKAKQLIDLYIAQNTLSAMDVYKLQAAKDTMDRVAIDFSKSKEDVQKYIAKYYPNLTDDMLAKWEEEKSLESMIIDGGKRYFSRAASNLFRINAEAKARKLEVDGASISGSDSVLATYLPKLVAQLSKSGKAQGDPVKMKVKYTVKLKPNAIPEGEVVRCWLPYPQGYSSRQRDIKLLSAAQNGIAISPCQPYGKLEPSYGIQPYESFTISPLFSPHSAMYMEGITEVDKPLEFSYEFTYSSIPEWYNLSAEKVRPYDIESKLYKTYTAERESHVVFTDKIKELSKQIVGDETNPYLKVKKIYEWIDSCYPWAGAREYSTIPNIPMYVLENKHGDCGQVSLLFITLARCSGVPAKWQSGFMLHPGEVNLHDWAEVYYEGVGWVPVDQSFGRKDFSTDERVTNFFMNGIDGYRLIVNDDYGQPLFPAKIYPRSETVDFQRGELEWRGGNIYFNKWSWSIEVEYLK